MFLALFIAFCLQLPPIMKHEESPRIQQVVKVEQPDLIKWNLQFFYDAMQRDDRNDMNKFAEKSIELLKDHKEYGNWLKRNNKDEYYKLTNLKKIIPPPLKIEYPKEVGDKSCKNSPKQIPYVPAKRYTIPGEQIPIRRDNMPGNRHSFRTSRK